ncbi:MAG TPA: DUF3352 domain-containing protein [Solirubrobacteraceae bacterium]|nr:DUF3352 domain-containing protein [Solirubrobacteraceae bacterium]
MSAARPAGHRRTVHRTIRAVALGLLVPLLAGCGAARTPAPPDAAATVVPADALAYLHVSLDTGRPAVAAALTRARRLPGYERLLHGIQARLEAITGVPVRELTPWVGREAALAFLPSASGARELIVLGVAHRRAAERFLATTHAPAARILRGELVLGESAAVSAAAAAAAHPPTALAAQAAFRRALAAAPADRVLDGWASATGISELLGGAGGVRGALAAALAGHASVGAALSPTGTGLRVQFSLAGISATRPAPTRFTPTLFSRLPVATTWAVDMPSLTRSMPALLGVLAAGSAAAPTRGLLGRLAGALRAQGVAATPLVAALSGEGAIFSLNGGLGLMARTAHPRASRLAFAAAGDALVGLFAPAPGLSTVPVVATRGLDGVAVTSWQEGPAVLELAVEGDTVVLTNSSAAMGAVLSRSAPLSASARFRAVLPGPISSAGPVLYGEIDRLERRADQSGLLESLGLRGASATLARISAVGLRSTGGPTETRAEMYLTIP